MMPREKALARRLCVLRGFTLDAASAIGSMQGSPSKSIIDELQRLVDRSIVQVDRSGKTPRFRFLESVREFLLEKLTEANEINAAGSDHLDYFINFAEYRGERLILGDGADSNRV